MEQIRNTTDAIFSSTPFFDNSTDAVFSSTPFFDNSTKLEVYSINHSRSAEGNILQTTMEQIRNTTDALFSWKPLFDNSTSEVDVYGSYSEKIILSACIFVVFTLGIVGNSFVIAAVKKSKRLQTTINVFVVNLAVADAATCLFLPVQVFAVLGVDGWPLPNAPWVCVMGAFVHTITLGSSVNCLTLIAINRWVAVTKYRATTRRIYTRRKLTAMVGVSWGLPLCCALVPTLTNFGELGYNKIYRSCSWRRDIQYGYQYATLVTLVNYPIQFALIGFSYTSIFFFVRKSSQRMARAYAPSISSQVIGDTRMMRRKLRQRQIDVTKNLLYIVFAFILCLTPYAASINFKIHKMVPWGAFILACNSFVNPIIYATTHPDFREIFKYMLRCQKIPKSVTCPRSK